MLKTSAVDARVFTLNDLVGELNDRGISIKKVTKIPDSKITV